jgi:hypothetical protein
MHDQESEDQNKGYEPSYGAQEHLHKRNEQNEGNHVVGILVRPLGGMQAANLSPGSRLVNAKETEKQG